MRVQPPLGPAKIRSFAEYSLRPSLSLLQTQIASLNSIFDHDVRYPSG